MWRIAYIHIPAFYVRLASRCSNLLQRHDTLDINPWHTDSYRCYLIWLEKYLLINAVTVHPECIAAKSANNTHNAM